MKTYLVLAVSIILSGAIYSQTYKLDRQEGYEGYFDDYIIDIEEDPQGNVYILSNFSNYPFRIDYFPFQLSFFGKKDFIVAKYDSIGRPRWAYSFGSKGDDEGKDIHYANGLVWVTGYFSDSIDLRQDNVHSDLWGRSEGGHDIFLMYLNSDNGSVAKWKSFGGKYDDEGTNLYQIDGGLEGMLTGFFQDTVDFTESINKKEVKVSNGKKDVFLKHFVPGSSYGGVYTWGGPGDDIGKGVFSFGFDKALVGEFEGSVNFSDSANGTLSHANGKSDVFIKKFDKNFQSVWTKTLGGPGSDTSIGVFIDDGKNYYLAGNFSGTLDFDPNQNITYRTSKGGSDGYVLKLSKFGDFKWVKTIGGTENDLLHSFKIGAGQRILCAGEYSGSVEFGSRKQELKTSKGFQDAFAFIIDTTGSLEWLAAFGGEENVRCRSIASFSPEKIYLVGDFRGIVDFDPSDLEKIDTTYRGIDGFRLVFGKCPQPEVEVTQENHTLKSMIIGQSYQWINCANNQKIIGARSQFYDPENEGEYAVEVKDNGCEYYSRCYGFSTSIQKVNESNGINIWPNPSKGIFYVSMPPNHEEFELSIYDIKGTLIYNKKKVDKINNELYLNPGVFTLLLKSNSYLLSKRVVITP